MERRCNTAVRQGGPSRVVSTNYTLGNINFHDGRRRIRRVSELLVIDRLGQNMERDFLILLLLLLPLSTISHHCDTDAVGEERVRHDGLHAIRSRS